MEPLMHLHIRGGSIYPEQAPPLAGRVEGLPFGFAQGKCAQCEDAMVGAFRGRARVRSDLGPPTSDL